MHYVCVLHSRSVDEFCLHSCVMMLTEHLEHLPPPLKKEILEISLTAVGSDFSGGVNWTTVSYDDCSNGGERLEKKVGSSCIRKTNLFFSSLLCTSLVPALEIQNKPINIKHLIIFHQI